MFIYVYYSPLFREGTSDFFVAILGTFIYSNRFAWFDFNTGRPGFKDYRWKYVDDGLSD